VRVWVRVVAAALAVSLVGGCGAEPSVGDLEEMLAGTYLAPLTEAGLTTSVTRACRILNPGDAEDTAATTTGGRPWHLAVDIDIDAPAARVADLLEAEDVVLRRDHDPMIVQQEFNKPGHGWDGILTATGDRSTLSLEHGNLAHDKLAGSLGWADVCTDRP
jgi:hypothetical protein